MGDRRRAGSRPLLHPGRITDLFGRAGWPGRLAALALLGLFVVGCALLVLPFTVDRSHPAPPPLTLRLSCPPAVVSAVAGAGGIANPVPEDPEVADSHDRLCRSAARPRVLAGTLFAAAGLVNAAAVLEWARVRRRARRRRRRAGASRRSG